MRRLAKLASGLLLLCAAGPAAALQDLSIYFRGPSAGYSQRYRFDFIDNNVVSATARGEIEVERYWYDPFADVIFGENYIYDVNGISNAKDMLYWSSDSRGVNVQVVTWRNFNFCELGKNPDVVCARISQPPRIDLMVRLGGAGDGSYRLTAFPVTLVPEPQVWMQMIAGFGLLGAALRRRRIHVA